MELSWTTKLRIAAAAAVGVALIGVFAWPLTAPSEISGEVDFSGVVILLALAVVSGFVGFFVSWPYGREIGILSVPFGLAVWATRSGSMAALMQLNPSDTARLTVLHSLKWQPVLWLAVVAAGFVGPVLCQRALSKPEPAGSKSDSKPNPARYLSPIIAVPAAAFIAYVCIGVFAQDVRLGDKALGFVMAQPAMGQLGFAVLMSFGVAAFAVRKLLGVGYVFPAIASLFVTAFAISSYGVNVQYMAHQWPAAFFSNTAASILPCQMVDYGVLGSVAGYWMAARYDHWRKYEM